MIALRSRNINDMRIIYEFPYARRNIRRLEGAGFWRFFEAFFEKLFCLGGFTDSTLPRGGTGGFKHAIQFTQGFGVIHKSMADIALPGRKVGYSKKMPTYNGREGNALLFYATDVAARTGFGVDWQILLHFDRL